MEGPHGICRIVLVRENQAWNETSQWTEYCHSLIVHGQTSPEEKEKASHWDCVCVLCFAVLCWKELQCVSPWCWHQLPLNSPTILPMCYVPMCVSCICRTSLWASVWQCLDDGARAVMHINTESHSCPVRLRYVAYYCPLYFSTSLFTYLHFFLQPWPHVVKLDYYLQFSEDLFWWHSRSHRMSQPLGWTPRPGASCGTASSVSLERGAQSSLHHTGAALLKIYSFSPPAKIRPRYLVSSIAEQPDVHWRCFH